MTQVLVTGGTGMLGSYLVPRLTKRGHEVRVLSRRVSIGLPEGASSVAGDVRTGQGLPEAVAGVEVVIHAATSPRRRARATEVEGTRRVLAVTGAVGAHFLYVSIVGVDQHRFPYYRAKWAAEQIVESEGARWTIQRATQFHDLLDQFLGMRVFPTTRHLAFQLVDAGEVSDRLVDLVDAGPSGRVEDYGGPEVLPVGEINGTRQRVTGKRALLVPLPPVGFLGDLDRGLQLCPEHRQGRITWEAWLRATQAQTDTPDRQ